MAKKTQKASEMLDDNNESETAGVGHNSGSVIGKRLKSFIERVERLEEEKKGIADDIKDVYDEAKGAGLCAKTMRKIVTRRKISKEVREEQDYLLDQYEHALLQ